MRCPPPYAFQFSFFEVDGRKGLHHIRRIWIYRVEVSEHLGLGKDRLSHYGSHLICICSARRGRRYDSGRRGNERGYSYLLRLCIIFPPQQLSGLTFDGQFLFRDGH